MRSRRIWPVPWGSGLIDKSIDLGAGPCGFTRSALSAARAVRSGEDMVPPKVEGVFPVETAKHRMRRVRAARKAAGEGC